MKPDQKLSCAIAAILSGAAPGSSFAAGAADTEASTDQIAELTVTRAADLADYIGARFHNLIVDGIKRAKLNAAPQSELKLPPVPGSAARKTCRTCRFPSRR